MSQCTLICSKSKGCAYACLSNLLSEWWILTINGFYTWRTSFNFKSYIFLWNQMIPKWSMHVITGRVGTKYIGIVLKYIFSSTCLYFVLELQKCTCTCTCIQVHYKVLGTWREVHCKFIPFCSKNIYNIIYFSVIQCNIFGSINLKKIQLLNAKTNLVYLDVSM